MILKLNKVCLVITESMKQYSYDIHFKLKHVFNFFQRPEPCISSATLGTSLIALNVTQPLAQYSSETFEPFLK